MAQRAEPAFPDLCLRVCRSAAELAGSPLHADWMGQGTSMVTQHLHAGTLSRTALLQPAAQGHH